jgi:hypothetical protein
MVARLLAAVPRLNAAECTKGRFFDRASDKLNQLAKFATNELVSFDLHAMASALADEVPSKSDGALPTPGVVASKTSTEQQDGQSGAVDHVPIPK